MITTAEDLAAARTRKRHPNRPSTRHTQVETALDGLQLAIIKLAASPNPPFADSQRVGRARVKVLALIEPGEQMGRRTG